MSLPGSIPRLKVATFLVGLYGVVWIALEGDLGRAILLAAGIMLVALGYGSRRLGGRRFSRPGWLLLWAAGGVLLGGGTGLLALLLMAVKTGLHAHGPEFTATEIVWVAGQLPWWAAGGFVGGVGIGLILLAWQEEEDQQEE